MSYIVTQNIESPNKVAKYLYVFDFFFLIAYMGVTFALASLVHSKLHIIYYIFSFLMAIFLTSKSTYNKGRRNYESILLMLQKDILIYKPYISKEKENDEE